MNLCRGDIKVFSGNANKKLAEDICKELGVPCGRCEVGKFSDGEIFVNIDETVRGSDLFLIQPTCTPVNNNLMELLILIDAFKRASAGRINAVIPYYGYARQDRKTKAREPITAKLVADLLTVAGIDRVVSMDLHAGQIQGYFNLPVDHLSGVPILAEYFKKIVDRETVIVSPDLGGVTRARNFANLLDLPIAIIEKRRPKANVSEVMNIIGDIEGKNAIIVDDIIDTAGTITKAAQVLKNFGAKKVYACATHPVLSGPAIERIEESVIEKFVVTDTIPLEEEKKIDKIEVVSVAPMFAEVIKRIHDNESVSILFD
ncbi:ribose-phosphate pyrophosphokinase [Keratinibaculum paraultunense]|uniref:Ribose-phosphate pyrophosphokinase n=1 Tax=Keratinibaculum paraultunense TaxID=1278232 RepID=A0A4R3KUM3_9FIRM|nr:ribose-phosphate pyrophosphokinase [Keratinibaculum paraultunense]QQY79498.1 ribose-phosphate pyrophosphokinase [Keratinibaculum paraultunense]TCS88007.1 ribose-phosphate pyrophosphokinase [Keratinibaculum paraultunense]